MTDPTKRTPEDQAEINKHLLNVATRQQAKQRRLNEDERRVTGNVTLEQLPLFADELSISIAVLGKGKYSQWRAVVPLLERRGFPTIDGLMGGRYVPAVKAFFDREHRTHGDHQVSAPDGPTALGSWKGHRSKRPRKASDR